MPIKEDGADISGTLDMGKLAGEDERNKASDRGLPNERAKRNTSMRSNCDFYRVMF